MKPRLRFAAPRGLIRTGLSRMTPLTLPSGLRVATVACLSLAFVWLSPGPAMAYKAGGHYALAAAVRDALPAGSVIRTAMEHQDGSMAFGSNGPDIPAGTDAVAFGMAPWFDNYHDTWPGLFTPRLLRAALQSGDEKQIAFAADWVTHVAGDLNVHGVLVNPRAGMYLIGDRGLHSDLEAYADPVTWKDCAGLPIEWYDDSDIWGQLVTGEENELWTHFAQNPGPGVRDLLKNTTWAFDAFRSNTTAYNDTSFYQLWTDTDWDSWTFYWYQLVEGDETVLGLDARQFLGGLYHDYDDAKAQLGPQGIADVHTAWNGSKALAVQLLTAAMNDEYDGFQESWYLDAGPYPIDQRSIGNMIVRVSTKDVSGAGTNDDVYFEFQTVDGRTSGRQLLDLGVGKVGNWYSDFEPGDNDVYQVFYPQTAMPPSSIARVWLYKTPDGIAGGWRPNELEVFLNGDSVIRASSPKWLQDDDRTWVVDLPDEWRQRFIPKLTQTVEGPTGLAGWYRGDVTVRLHAVETALSGGVTLDWWTNTTSGSATGHYECDGQITITDEGTTPLRYNAEDRAGDIAPTRGIDVKIDKTPPVITSLMDAEYLTGKPLTIAWKAEDPISGVAVTSATLDGNPASNGEVIPNGLAAGMHTLAIAASDVAGNSTSKTLQFEVLIDALADKVDPYFVNPSTAGGTITFYLEFPSGYDVSTINPGSSTMAVNGISGIPSVPQLTTCKDYDRDGRKEYALKFDRADLLAAAGAFRGEIDITLRGRLFDGRGFLTGVPATAVITSPSRIVPPRVP